MMNSSASYRLRRQDYSLAPRQTALAERTRAFFAEHCDMDRVRAAEPLGFDPDLWRSFLASGLADGDGLVDAVLVAEMLGQAAAPLPFATHTASRRLLNRAGDSAGDGAGDGGPREPGDPDGAEPVALALRVATGTPQLVPDAATGRRVLAHTGTGLVLATSPAPLPHAGTMGAVPQAWWALDDTVETLTLATGAPSEALWRQAVTEWKLLVAANLVGLTQAALERAVAVARTRRTLGVPIGTLQGVAFPLADVEIAVSGARNLVRRAAWFLDNEPGHRPELAAMAYVNAARTAVAGTTACAHVQGGAGYAEGSDAAVLVLRARAWSALAGDPAADLLAIAEALPARVGR
ncbi:acyl-CoA dehydrogenase family protein [Streptosporangium sp. NPDC051022]|uniref:acyl-CoA dehydrogenase family protein n=1 Tax=Streptosporangium sp. NPDC051022 TaxID=3155752 RepID=UPI00341D135F